MISLEQVKQQHPTAVNVEQLKTNQLFLITYPGLVLAINYDGVIAFNYADEWYLCTVELSKSSGKHKYYLIELFQISHWFTDRRAFIEELRNIVRSAGND